MLSLLPLPALAATPVATVGGTPYYDIGTAWLAATVQGRGVLQLQKDWNTKSWGRLVVPTGETVTVDLNNYDIDRGLPGKDSYSNIGSFTRRWQS